MADIAIKVRGLQVGLITDGVRSLDKAGFLSLSTSDRIVTYLALVWPHARRGRTIARVCHLRCGDITNYGRELLRIGTIRRVSRGRYALVREETKA